MTNYAVFRKLTVVAPDYPFILGGDVHEPMKVDLYVEAYPVALSKQIKAFCFRAPNGKDVLVEDETGVVIGYDLTSVMNDVDNASLEVIQQNMRDNRIAAKRAHYVGPNYFWKTLGI